MVGVLFSWRALSCVSTTSTRDRDSEGESVSVAGGRGTRGASSASAWVRGKGRRRGQAGVEERECRPLQEGTGCGVKELGSAFERGGMVSGEKRFKNTNAIGDLSLEEDSGARTEEEEFIKVS